jgi:AcrR family transcriptional regulator
VTLRDVAERVGIHTTLLNYYFKDKVNLFEAVFARRAGVTAGRRMVALEQYERRRATARPSRARCTPSSIPTSTSITRAASTG